MGWLRTLMDRAAPPLSSYGILARVLLESKSWPEETRMKERSLAAMLSKLDDGEQLEWLAARPLVQRELARVLAAPLADIERELRRDATPEPSVANSWRLPDMPAARSLDLFEEPLPPGIPTTVTEPARWKRLWWQAQAGSGRELVGHWLEARGLARYYRVRRANQLNALSLEGAVYIELEMEGNELARAAAKSLSLAQHAQALDVRLCIAAGTLPQDDEWQIVESPEPRSYLSPLVRWAAERLPADGRFQSNGVLAWLQALDARGFIDGLQTAIGLCALADEVGMRVLKGRSLGQLAERFIELRVAEAVRSYPTVAWLKREGFGALVALFGELLAESRTGWDMPRPFDAWLELVPEEYARDVDLEWLKLTLVQPGEAIRASDIEKAARRVPPGAFRLVRGLEQVGLLQPTSTARALQQQPEVDALLVFTPRWLAVVLEHEARRALLRSAEARWGEALLYRHGAEGMLVSLSEHLRQDLAPLEELADVEGHSEPSYAAAVEGALRAAGDLLLSGVELPHEALEPLFDAQLQLAVVHNALPAPRLPLHLSERPEPRAYMSSRRMLGIGFWWAALWSVGEALGARPLRHALLQPWHLSTAHPQLAGVYDHIWQEVAEAEPDDWVLGTFTLIDRLRRQLGPAQTQPHPLELPGIVLQDLLLGDATRLRQLEPTKVAVEALFACGAQQGLSADDIVTYLWRCAPQISTLDATILDPTMPHPRVWQRTPEVAFALLNAQGRAIPYAALGEEGWQAWQRWMLQADVDSVPPAAVTAMPETTTAELAEPEAFARLNAAARQALWRREPELLSQRLEAHLRASQLETALDLALTAPLELRGALARSLFEARIAILPGSRLAGLTAWAYAAVAERAPEWLEAYRLLDALETSSSRAATHKSL